MFKYPYLLLIPDTYQSFKNPPYVLSPGCTNRSLYACLHAQTQTQHCTPLFMAVSKGCICHTLHAANHMHNSAQLHLWYRQTQWPCILDLSQCTRVLHHMTMVLHHIMLLLHHTVQC